MKGRFKNRVLAFLTVLVLCLSAINVPVFALPEAGEQMSDDVVAYAILGEKAESKGMSVWMGNVNEPATANKEGKDAWILDTSNGKNSIYIYVDVDDSIMSNLTDGTNIEVEIEYYDDTEKGSLSFEYPEYRVYNMRTRPFTWKSPDIGEQLSTELEIFDFGGSNCWMTKTWLLQNPALNNSLEKGDFRIGVWSTAMGNSENEKTYIHSVKVKKTGTKSQVDIAFEKNDDYAMNFFDGEKMEFDVSFDNSKNLVQSRLYGKYTADVTYTLLDSEYKTVVEVKKDKITLEPGIKTVKKVAFDTKTFNVYELKVEVENDDLGIYSTYSEKCAYIPKNDGFNQRAGINTTVFPLGKDGDAFIELLKNTGFRHIRNPMTGINLAVTASAYEEDNTRANEHALNVNMQEFLGKLAANDMTLLGMHGQPKAKQYSYYQFESNPPYNGNYIPYTPEGYERYTKSALELIRLEGSYGSEAFNFEIGNEWDLMYPRDAVALPKATGKLYRYVYPRIKEQYPDLTVGGPVISGVYSNVNWFKYFFEEVGQNLDVITLHPYTNHGHPIQYDILRIKGTPEDCHLLDIRELADSMGLEDREIWATEWGCMAYTRECYGHRQQAAWNSILYLQQLEENVVDRFYFFQTDDTKLERSYGERNFGVLDYRKCAKPQLLALSNLNNLTNSARFESRTDLNNKQTIIYKYKRENDGKDLIALMTSVDSETVSFDLGTNSVTMYDMYGNPTELVSPDGTYTFAFNEEPVYIEGDFSNYEIIEKSNVGIVSSLRVAGHGTTATVSAYNGSGEKLSMTATPKTLNKTEVISNTGLEGESGQLVLGIDKAPVRGSEPVYVEIKGEKGTYFAGNVYISHQSAADITTVAYCDENMNWFIDAEIENLLDEEQKGSVMITDPVDWICEIKDVSVGAFEKKTVTIPLPQGAGDNGNKMVTIAFVVDEEGNGTYSTNAVEFAYAPKAASAPVVDGKLDEWTKGWLYMNSAEQFAEMTGFANTFYGATDLWAKVAVQWDEENFYFAAEVHDDVFINNVIPSQMWSQDNIQLGIIYDPDNEYAPGRFEELSFSLNNGKPALYRHSTVSQNLEDTTKLSDYDLEITKDGDTLYYELRVSWNDLMPNIREPEKNKIVEGTTMRFGCIINESDGGDRKGFYYIGNDGIGNTKNSSKFTNMYMAGIINN